MTLAQSRPGVQRNLFCLALTTGVIATCEAYMPDAAENRAVDYAFELAAPAAGAWEETDPFFCASGREPAAV